MATVAIENGESCVVHCHLLQNNHTSWQAVKDNGSHKKEFYLYLMSNYICEYVLWYIAASSQQKYYLFSIRIHRLQSLQN